MILIIIRLESSWIQWVLIDWRDSSCSRSRLRLYFYIVLPYYNGCGRFFIGATALNCFYLRRLTPK